MSRGLFIAFEGIDGSGKSTQAQLLAEALQKAGLKVHATFEPTDSRIGQIIRDIMKGKMDADHRTIAALFVADRLDHILNNTNGILKKLAEGYWVITDRYYFSSYAYQGAHVPLSWVIEANSLSAELLRPDLNVFVDVPPEVGIQRVHRGRTATELYETIDNLQRVRATYMEAFELLKVEENIFITDGNRTVEAIASDIWTEVSRVRIKVTAS